MGDSIVSDAGVRIHGSEFETLSREEVSGKVRDLLDRVNYSFLQARSVDDLLLGFAKNEKIDLLHATGALETFVKQDIPSLASDGKSDNDTKIYFHGSNALVLGYETPKGSVFVLLNDLSGEGKELAVFGGDSNRINIERLLREWSKTAVRTVTVKTLFDALLGIEWFASRRDLKGGKVEIDLRRMTK